MTKPDGSALRHPQKLRQIVSLVYHIGVAVIHAGSLHYGVFKNSGGSITDACPEIGTVAAVFVCDAVIAALQGIQRGSG